MIDKAPDAYRTISEVAEDLDLPQHVLRFWETRFVQIKPLKRGGGRRYYRPDDVELLKGIRHLLYAEGYTIKGVQRILKEQGPKAVQSLVQSLLPGDENETPDLDSPAPPARPPQAQPAPQAPPVQARFVDPPPLDPPPAEHWAAPQPAPMAPPIAVAPPPPPVVPAPDYTARRSEPQAYVPPPPHYHPQYQPPVYQPPQAYSPPPAPPAPVIYPPGPELFPSVAEPVPQPAPLPQPTPRAPGATAFMRGGLARTGAGASVAPLPVEPSSAPPSAPPQTSFGINVRRTITPVPPLPEPAAAPRYSPLVEPDLGRDLPPAAGTGLTEDSRRALQSALFELTECRRTIDRVIAGRER